MADIYYLTERFNNPNFGGIKARNDIDYILNNQNYKPIPIDFCHLNQKSIIGFSKTIYRGLKNWFIINRKITKKSNIFIQYPFGNAKLNTILIKKMKSNRDCKFVAIIHDLQSFQDKQITRQNEINLLSQFDVVICHNKKMKGALIKEGIPDSKLVTLNLFDYLTNEKPVYSRNKGDGIVVAGNLAPFKASYVYKIASTNLFNLVLYGPNFDESYSDSTDYRGSYPADKLLCHIKGSFGLVWDGDSLDTCNGTFGEYQKINNPHRVSMYLAAQIPIIIWNKAALRDFIVENNLGIGVDNLYQIPQVIASLNNDEYQNLVESTKEISKKLRSGYYTSDALSKALKILT